MQIGISTKTHRFPRYYKSRQALFLLFIGLIFFHVIIGLLNRPFVESSSHVIQRDILLIPQSSANQMTSPLHLAGNLEVDAYFAGNGSDGLTWASAYRLEAKTFVALDYGILIENSSRFLILQNNTIKDAKTAGISIYNCFNFKLLNNTVQMNRFRGIDIRNSSDGVIEGNLASDNYDDGIALEDSRSITLKTNQVTENRLRGIYLLRTNNSLILANYIVNNNAEGIYVDNSHGNTIQSNQISQNRYGISLGKSSANNEIFQNQLSSNDDANIWFESSVLEDSNNLHDNETKITNFTLGLVLVVVAIGIVFLIFLIYYKKQNYKSLKNVSNTFSDMGSDGRSISVNYVSKSDEIKIFISYSHSDEQFFQVPDLALLLERQFGFQTRYYKRDIVSGESLQDYMELGIQWCNVFLWLHSENTLKSSASQEEYRMAKYSQKKIITISSSPANLPLAEKTLWYIDYSPNLSEIVEKISKGILSKKDFSNKYEAH